MRPEAQRLAACGTLSLLGQAVPGALLDLGDDRSFVIRSATEGETLVLTDEQSEFSLRLLPTGLAIPVGDAPQRHLVFQLVAPKAAIVTESGGAPAAVRIAGPKSIEVFHPASGASRWFVTK